MADIYSKDIITRMMNAERENKHFTKWSEEAKKNAIRKCGIASSKFKNKTERDTMLTHLHSTNLPVDPSEVQRQIRLLGLPPSGARSLQQFAFYLLSFLCEALPFPPWRPIPIVTIVPPTITTLCEQARAVCKARIPDEPPYAYRLQDGKLVDLWVLRRKMWDRIATSLETPDSASSLCQFLLSICGEYAKVMNVVLSYNPKTKLSDLRCALDAAQWQVDRTYAPKEFFKFWCQTTGECIAAFKCDEWSWLLPYLIIACRWSLSSSIRNQFDEDAVDDLTDYVGDSVRSHDPHMNTHQHTFTFRCYRRTVGAPTIVLGLFGGRCARSSRMYRVFLRSSTRCSSPKMLLAREVYPPTWWTHGMYVCMYVCMCVCVK